MIQTFTLVSDYLNFNKNKQQTSQFVVDSEPSDFVVQNILNYSKALAIKKSNSVGFIDIIAN